MSEPFGDEELEFPILCHYKIIADDLPGVKEMIEKKLQDLGIINPMTEGSKSSNGKYVTFNIDIKVASKEFMNDIDTAIRSTKHVKMVL